MHNLTNHQIRALAADIRKAGGPRNPREQDLVATADALTPEPPPEPIDEPCQKCDGTGERPLFTSTYECESCGGSGRVLVFDADWYIEYRGPDASPPHNDQSADDYPSRRRTFDDAVSRNLSTGRARASGEPSAEAPRVGSWATYKGAHDLLWGVLCPDGVVSARSLRLRRA